MFFTTNNNEGRKSFIHCIPLKSEMMHLNNKSKKNVIAVVTLLTLATIVVMLSSMATTSVEATTTSNATTTTTTIPSSGIELSPQAVYQEQEKLESQIPINQTHVQITVSGNGMLTLPNGTETIRITSTRSGIASMINNDFAGKAIWTTEDGSESATATIYELVRFNMQDGSGKGIIIAVFHTNSTGMLAALDGMIMAGIDELHPDATGLVTLWEWQSGIPYVKMPPLQESPTNTTASL
ncbi:MAG TPA: hypothetical protein VFH09_03055 [Nitrososphaera sp.]|nr:hypothetical protein [Nitrososphaera sp.]